MTLRALGATVRGHRERCAGVFGVVQLHEVVVVLVVLGIEGHLAVAVNAPAHGKSRILVYHFHVLDGAVAGLALQASHLRVLRVVEVRQVGQVVNVNAS